MIEIYDSLDEFDLLYYYTETTGCAFLYFKNESFSRCDENKKREILNFYEEFLPDDIFELIKQNRYYFIKFSTLESAIANALEWFPQKKYLPDPDYYWKCYAISGGEIEYENIDNVEHLPEGA